MNRMTRLLGSILLLTLAGGCATNPVTGVPNLVLMSEQEEIARGRKTHAEVLKQYPVYDNPEIQALVNRVGQELAAQSHRSHLDFTFTVLDSPQVNAFATPGGYIYVTRGIMAYMNSEEELAGVLGHEIGHVTARHSVRQHSAQAVAGLGSGLAVLTRIKLVTEVTNLVGQAFVSGYGRSHELEADRLGAEYLAGIGYDPQKMLGVVGILKDQEEFEKKRALDENRPPRVHHGVYATHPRNDQRLQEVIRAAEKYKNPNPRYSDRQAFLKTIDGMTFGESESQGVMRNNKFYHKLLDLHIALPDGWQVENQPTQLLALGPDLRNIIMIRLDKKNDVSSPRQFLREAYSGISNLQRLDAESYTGITRGETAFGQRPIRIAARFHGDFILVFSTFSVDRIPDRQFYDTVSSVRELRQSERELATTRSIRLVRAKPEDTFAGLARGSTLDRYAEDQLRLVNGMYPDGEPAAGQLIKIIE